MGGDCQTDASAQVIYAQPSKGSSTGSGLQVFRAYGDFEGVIGSGESVPQGVWLSLRAAPGTAHFVSDWSGCDRRRNRRLYQLGTAKSCLVFVDFGTSSLELAVSLRTGNSDFADNYPLPLTGPIDASYNTAANCTALGGTPMDFGPAAPCSRPARAIWAVRGAIMWTLISPSGPTCHRISPWPGIAMCRDCSD